MKLHRPESLLLRGLHLLVLCGFALAQPLYDILGRTPEFFVARGSTGWDVVVVGVALATLPAALLLAVEALAGLVSHRLQSALHLLFVGALAALIALQALRRGGDLPGWPLVAAAAALGALAAVAYSRLSPVRTGVTVLTPAPLVFLSLFLLSSPIEELQLANPLEDGSRPAVESRTPVTVIVFDELPTTSLLDADGRIDEGRFPSFASLAADATWFPNATTVHAYTGSAVPAILTGEDPDAGALPLVADHPRNLFTYLAESHRMNVLEPVTQLCPASVCERRRPPFAERMESLASDLRVVYLHVTLPEALAEDLPPIDDTWQDFGESAGEPAAEEALVEQLWSDQRGSFDRWLDGIASDAGGRPALNFIHSLLPHRPWRYLPEGKVYGNAATEGLRRDVWQANSWLVTQAYQRHLLQVGFADRLLGEILDRLRSTGLYDSSLVVVAADHGTSFRPGGRRRSVDGENVADVARVPLLVKLPRQERGQVDRRNARTTDVLPTVADVLGAPLPGTPDGRSLLDRDAADRSTVVIHRRDEAPVSVPASDVAARAEEALARKVAIFGSGDWPSVYEIGPHRELLGREVGSLTISDASELTATVDGESFLRDLDLDSPLAPSHLTGQISGEGANEPLDLAVAVNGRIAVMTRAVRLRGSTRFAGMAPLSAFREGANTVEVFAVRDANGRLALERLAGATSGGRLERAAAGEVVRFEGGETIEVVPGALEGTVERWSRELGAVRFVGWAADVSGRKVAERILVFADGRLVYSTASSFNRPDIARRHGVPEGAGFVLELPLAVAGDAQEIRFVAVRGGVASELAYAAGYPWR